MWLWDLECIACLGPALAGMCVVLQVVVPACTLEMLFCIVATSYQKVPRL
jgi:hypothetical protein